jgi:hypothetical protein
VNVAIAHLHSVFRRWFGSEYDLDAIDAVLACQAAQQLDGDPLWLLVIAGSGATKTETVCALEAVPGVTITSTISSEGALLSASPKRERSKDATGGLLAQVGPTGTLVIKDATSILSLNSNLRAGVLSALREIHDGRWQRNVGTDGGRTLTWTGRLAVIAACTTVWDRAHDVISSMGDGFVILRLDTMTGRQAAGLRAIANVGKETLMRRDLSEAVKNVLIQLDHRAMTVPTAEEAEAILAAANVVTLVRTGVEFDYRGYVVDAHAPEMPTRFAKQLVQMFRGAYAIGMHRTDALRLALRCARDSMPPLRLAILEDVALNPAARTKEIRQRVEKPYNTIDRQCQALHMLGVLDCDELEENGRTIWSYSLASRIDPTVIAVPEKLVDTQKHKEEGLPVTHISGTNPDACCQGGPLQAACKLCPQSPTYWQHADVGACA